MKQIMKARLARRSLFKLALMALLVAAFLSASAQAQSAGGQDDPQKPKGPSHTPASEKNLTKENIKGGKRPVEFSKEEREGMRGKLQELVDTIKTFSDTVAPGDADTADKIGKVKDQIANFTDEELDTYCATLDPSTMNKGLAQARATLEDYQPVFTAYYKAQKAHASRMSASLSGFPEVEGPDSVCNALVGSGRPSESLIIAADVVYLTALGVHALASRACQQVAVAVVLGEGGGGNASLACTGADVILALATALRDKVQACDNGYTKRSIDAAVRRLQYLHDEMSSNVNTILGGVNSSQTAVLGGISSAQTAITGSINSNATQTTTRITASLGDSQAAIIINSDANKAAIIAGGNSNRDTILANDNSNKDAIIANDNSNKSSIVANDNTNTALLLRSQIEADLQAPDNSVPLAMFETPRSNGGYLELVRTIVAQTISNLAGASSSQANSFLAQGDKYRDAGNYKAAYASYRQAYKSAAK